MKKDINKKEKDKIRNDLNSIGVKTKKITPIGQKGNFGLVLGNNREEPKDIDDDE